MSILVQMGPPGSEGASMRGIGGSSPAPAEAAALGGTPAIVSPSSSSGEEEVVTMRPDMAALKRFKSLRDLAPESPAVKLFTDTIVLLIDMFKLSMATMLVVFVPQLCPASSALYKKTIDPSSVVATYVGPSLAAFQPRWDGCSRETVPHECNFGENFTCLNTLNQFTLAWNFMCLAMLIFHYFLVWRREHYLIANFKETLTLGRLHVRDIIADYPTVRRRLQKYNKWVFYTSAVAIVMQLVNLIASGVTLFRDYNNGYKTFTTYFTNFLLLALVLYNCVTAAHIGIKHELAYSCVAFEPVSYNSINANHIKGK